MMVTRWHFLSFAGALLAASLLPAAPLRAQTPAPAGATTPAAPAALKPGDVLGPDNWQAAKDLLPPEILDHYRKGEYRNPIVAWPEGNYHWAPQFVEATKRNATELSLNADGAIVDKTGKQPPLVYGLPFPNIDEADPQAGEKVLWNYFYSYWEQGNSFNVIRLDWVNPTGIDRESGQKVYFLYYDGQAVPYRIPNPDNLSQQSIATTISPADLQGTTALTWRYRDSDKRDSAWVYVPALRRVRAVSPANRSDGFLGSDMSQDDGPFFDGKPEDFTWKLVGARRFFRLVDPKSIAGQTITKKLPGGGYRAEWPAGFRIGFQDPSWKGIAWAPIAAALAERRTWVIEGVPKDKYYLYGKLQLYFDAENYQGAWNRKFGWDGDLLNTLQAMGFQNVKVGETKGVEDWVWGSSHAYQCAENVKMNRATVGGDKLAGEDVPTDRRVPMEPSFFDFSNLQRFGK